MSERTEHPRYRGPVVDVHVHYDRTTLAHVPQVNALGGVDCAIHLWDVTWPPRPYAQELGAWRALEPSLLRCHMPDLSAVGASGFEQELGRALAADAADGCVGVKVWKNLGLTLRDVEGRRVAVDDERLRALWDAAAAHELPVLIHVGDPREHWQPLTDDNPRLADLRAHPEWWLGGGGFASLEQIHAEFERVVAAHPATTFVGAHFGCFLGWQEIDRRLGAYPNFNLDTAAAISAIGHGDVAGARDLFLRWPERILFGTDLVRTRAMDYPAFAAARWDLREFFARHWRFFETAERGLQHPIPSQVPWTVDGIDLPIDVLEALYRGNALRLYRLSRTP